MKKRNLKKKNTQNNFSKLSVFQNQKFKFKKKSQKEDDIDMTML